VTTQFRARLGERAADGAAHAEGAREERTTRYQLARAFADRTDRREARKDKPRRMSLDEAHHHRRRAPMVELQEWESLRALPPFRAPVP
jgi:hypothetical protein